MAVTWRKDADGGWSGLGPDSKLVFVEAAYTRPLYVYGRCFGKRKVNLGTRPTLAQAKRAAEELFNVD